MSDLYLNQFDLEIDHKLIDRDFFILKLSNDRYLSYQDLHFIDSLKSDPDNKTLSVCFSRGKTAYAIYERSTFGNLQDLKQNIPEQEDLRIEEVSSEEIKPEKVFQLFLNACSSSENARYRINNLTGKLFINAPEKAFYNKKDQSRIALEMKVLPDNFIKLETVTFTSLARYEDLAKNKYGINCSKKRKRLREDVKYIFDPSTSSFRRLFDDEEAKDKDKYVKRRVPERLRKGKKKSAISFFSLEPSKYPNTKIALFNELFFESFEPRFGAYFKYSQKSLPESSATKTSKSISDSGSNLKQIPIRLIDNVGEEEQIKDIRKILTEKLGIKVRLAKKCSADCLNLQFNHDPVFYKREGSPDPYKKSTPDCAIQNFTLQQFDKNGENQLLKTLSEGHIKFDIAKKQLTIFDWKKLNLEKAWYFALANQETNDSEIDFHFLEISPDGALKFSTLTRDLFNEKFHRTMADAFTNPKGKIHYQVEGVILDEKGNLNQIQKTDIQTFPNLEETHKKIMSGVELEGVELPCSVIKGFTKEFIESHGKNEQITNLKNWLETLPNDEPVLLTEVKKKIHTRPQLNIQFAELFKKRFGFWLKNLFKNKDAVAKNFASMVDVHAVKKGDDFLFWSNKDMGKSKGEFTKTNVIRRLKSYRGSDSLFEPLLQTMSVDFVRVDAPSVIPFPFKLLREYIAMNEKNRSADPGINLDEFNF